MPRITDWYLLIQQENEKRGLNLYDPDELLYFLLKRFKFIGRVADYLNVSWDTVSRAIEKYNVNWKRNGKFIYPELSKEQWEQQYIDIPNRREIAEKLGTSEAYVRTELIKAGVKMNHDHAPWQKWVQCEEFYTLEELLRFLYIDIRLTDSGIARRVRMHTGCEITSRAVRAKRKQHGISRKIAPKEQNKAVAVR